MSDAPERSFIQTLSTVPKKLAIIFALFIIIPIFLILLSQSLGISMDCFMNTGEMVFGQLSQCGWDRSTNEALLRLAKEIIMFLLENLQGGGNTITQSMMPTDDDIKIACDLLNLSEPLTNHIITLFTKIRTTKDLKAISDHFQTVSKKLTEQDKTEIETFLKPYDIENTMKPYIEQKKSQEELDEIFQKHLLEKSKEIGMQTMNQFGNENLKSQGGRRRKSVTRGWRKQAPSKKQRSTMRKRCGKKCFLGAKGRFPICKKHTCKVDKRGVYAAFIRAKQWKHSAIAKKALQSLRSLRSLRKIRSMTQKRR